MSGDCLRVYPQPTTSAPAQVWSGLVGFLVDFHALGYTKTKGDLPTGLTAAKIITEADDWAMLVRHASAVLAVVLGVEAGVEPADALEPAIADLLQPDLCQGSKKVRDPGFAESKVWDLDGSWTLHILFAVGLWKPRTSKLCYAARPWKPRTSRF